MITRRAFSLAAALAPLSGRRAFAQGAAQDDRRAAAWARLARDLPMLETQSGGRLGVAALDTASGRSFAHRGDERFPITSTFKLLAAAAVLARVDAGASALEKILRYEERDVVTYSPATKPFAGQGKGMTLDALCEAALTLSDNTAGNLLLREIGGPSGIGAFARTLGDPLTRLDRWETELNEALPGDERDTTTPGAMLADLQKLALGDALKPASREKLVGWLKGCKTSADRMKASLPPGWIVGDKTGAGERGTMNDVGVIWPPDGAPILLTIYLTATDRPQPERAAIHREIGRLVAAAARA